MCVDNQDEKLRVLLMDPNNDWEDVFGRDDGGYDYL
jgi:hypothetical protein